MSTFVQQEINKRNRWVYFSKYRWLAHVAYWTWVLIVGTFMAVNVPVTPSILLNHFILANLHIAVFFYLYCLILIPYFFKRNKNLIFWLLVLASFLLIPVSDVYFSRSFVHYTGIDMTDRPKGFLGNYMLVVMGYLINFLIFSMLLFFMEKNEENNLLMEVEQEKKEIEQVKLDLLKTNISPDFMMRSLNQLKRSALVPEPYTPESIIKFSELLRYRLYRGKQLQTPLAEELQALEDFISFIAFDQSSNRLRVELQVTGNTETKFIAALALVNVMEPFCKLIPDHPALLKLNVFIADDTLQLNIIYNQQATAALFTDLNQYGADYTGLYGNSIQFNFEECDDDSCKIEMILPLISKHA